MGAGPGARRGGRVLLWPLNAAAGRAAARQEYLGSYTNR